MTPRIALAAIFTLSIGTPAVAQWTWLNPKPQGHTLKDVEFLDNQTAIAIGDFGTLLITHDAGLTWSGSSKTQGITGALNAITRVDDQVALIVGAGGVILKTTNGGISWSVIPSGTTAGLTDVDYQDGLAIAAGNGVARRSTDEGDSWESVNNPYNFNRVDVVSDLVVVSYVDYLFLRSEDAGTTWTPFFLPGSFSAVAFVDSQNGVLASRLSTFLFTSDGGQTWVERFGPSLGSHYDATASEMALDGIDQLYVSATAGGCDPMMNCFSAGHLFRSTNGAEDWSVEWSARRLNGIARSATGVLILAGDGGALYRWAGEQWQHAGGSVYDEFDTSAGGAFLTPFIGIVAGTTTPLTGSMPSVLLRTSDGGANWSAKSLFGTFIGDVAFAASTPVAYAVGRNKLNGIVSTALLKSTDGGASWPIVWSSPSAPTLWSIEFQSSTHGVAVGDEGSFAIIDSDIVTTGSIPDGGSLTDVAFADASVVVAVGGGNGNPPTTSRIVRSVDGGSTWALVPHGTGSPLIGVDFATPSVGAAVGRDGRTLRTADGGETWDPVPSPITQHLTAVSFSTSSHGMAVGNAGRVLETIDSGQSWYLIDSPTNVGFRDVQCFSPTHAILTSWDLITIEYKQTPLPIAISSFAGTAETFSVDLSWEIQDEATIKSFRIVRSDASWRTRTFDGIAATVRYYRDTFVLPETRYEYTLIAMDGNGNEVHSAPITMMTSSAELALLPNVPNPFNPSTTIRYILPSQERVRVTIYDVAGRAVITLVDREESAGQYSVPWNGTDANGDHVASGVYLVRIEAGKQSLARKMVMLK